MKEMAKDKNPGRKISEWINVYKAAFRKDICYWWIYSLCISNSLCIRIVYFFCYFAWILYQLNNKSFQNTYNSPCNVRTEWVLENRTKRRPAQINLKCFRNVVLHLCTLKISYILCLVTCITDTGYKQRIYSLPCKCDCLIQVGV